MKARETHWALVSFEIDEAPKKKSLRAKQSLVRKITGSFFLIRAKSEA